ncbi:Fimbrial protein [Paraburkholderia piptadeniae]|uniref:Fimbrial protein n=1 Tax=Paraburkholderia piptadeniae TaxID=1701573 RepID=A0A1N7ST87_9BURK|nr:fimbrial protein [Paraburkholderia piptadeniae]SIT50578.1 Fimbrial protein [Paraburkholderia piptadeniae]
MKVKKSGLLIATAIAAGAALPTASFASDGTITFTGNITPNTCTISGNGGGPSFTVQLPPVSVGSFTASSPVSGKTPFNIALTNCTPSTGSASVYFEPGASVDLSTGQLKNMTGTATYVQVQLLDSNEQKVVIGAGYSPSNQTWVSIVNGSATMTYKAAYAMTGTVGAGTVNTTTMYSIVYQ